MVERNVFRKTGPSRGSHLPVLMKLVRITSGPILELGCGMYSTPFLHWACYATKRRLVTYEDNPKWHEFIAQFNNDFHTIHCVGSYNQIDIDEPWDIAFIDHSPESRRTREIRQVLHADYVVAHDAQNKADRNTHYSTIVNLFKYRYRYSDAYPHTVVLSNKHDLTDFTVI